MKVMKRQHYRQQPSKTGEEEEEDTAASQLHFTACHWQWMVVDLRGRINWSSGRNISLPIQLYIKSHFSFTINFPFVLYYCVPHCEQSKMPKIFALRDRLIRAQSFLAESGDRDRPVKSLDFDHFFCSSSQDNQFEEEPSIFSDLDIPSEDQGKKTLDFRLSEYLAGHLRVWGSNLVPRLRVATKFTKKLFPARTHGVCHDWFC